MNLREYLETQPRPTVDNLFHMMDHLHDAMKFIVRNSNGDELSEMMGEMAAAFQLVPSDNLEGLEKEVRLTMPLFMSISMCFLAETFKRHAELVQVFLSSPEVNIPPVSDPSTSGNIEHNPEL